MTAAGFRCLDQEFSWSIIEYQISFWIQPLKCSLFKISNVPKLVVRITWKFVFWPIEACKFLYAVISEFCYKKKSYGFFYYIDSLYSLLSKFYIRYLKLLFIFFIWYQLLASTIISCRDIMWGGYLFLPRLKKFFF